MPGAAHSFRADEVFLGYQREYHALLEKHDVVVVEKSRRVGLSWGDAADSCLTAAASREAGGQDCFYIGYNKDMAREYIEDVSTWAKQFKEIAADIEEDILRDEDKDITVFRIRFASGYKVEALSSRPSNLRGKQGKVTIDEAAFHDNLRGLVKAAMALLMWGGKVVIISTHFGDDNPFNEIVADTRDGKTGYALLRITLREALAQGLYRRICQVKGREWTQEKEDEWAASLYRFYGDAAGEELDVIPSGGQGQWLPRNLIERAMRKDIPVLRWRKDGDFTLQSENLRVAVTAEWLASVVDPRLAALNTHALHYFGQDFGRSGDLTVIWLLTRLPDHSLHTPFVIELRNIPFDQQRQILHHVLERIPRLAGGKMDARGNGQHLAEITMQKFGSSRAEPIMISLPWYREAMPPLKAAFEDATLTIPADSDTMLDLRAMEIVKGIARAPEKLRYKGADGGQRHADAAIALAMAHSAAKGEAHVYEYESVESAREWIDEFSL